MSKGHLAKEHTLLRLEITHHSVLYLSRLLVSPPEIPGLSFVVNLSSWWMGGGRAKRSMCINFVMSGMFKFHERCEKGLMVCPECVYEPSLLQYFSSLSKQMGPIHLPWLTCLHCLQRTSQVPHASQTHRIWFSTIRFWNHARESRRLITHIHAVWCGTPKTCKEVSLRRCALIVNSSRGSTFTDNMQINLVPHDRECSFVQERGFFETHKWHQFSSAVWNKIWSEKIESTRHVVRSLV